jgi:hypothetical protein
MLEDVENMFENSNDLLVRNNSILKRPGFYFELFLKYSRIRNMKRQVKI